MTTSIEPTSPNKRLYRLRYTEEKDGDFSLSGFKGLSPEVREQLGWANQVFDVTETWDTWAKLRGRGVRVAVLDTGVDLAHPALKDAIIAARDFTSRDASKDGDDKIERLDPSAADDDGHGTHCAGVIAARPISSTTGRAIEPNGLDGDQSVIPFQGVAPDAKLLIAKVLRTQDDGEVWGEPDWVVRGIRWAIQNKADIISMSFAARSSPPELYYAIQQALWLGKFVICAAGNNGALFQNGIGYPGRYGGVLTIAAHDRNGHPAGFSSTGGEIDFIGPGEGIWSTFVAGGQSGYRKLSGTSMATPFVSGLAALVVAKHKDPAALDDDPTLDELRAFAAQDGGRVEELTKLLAPSRSHQLQESAQAGWDGPSEQADPVREALDQLKRSDAFIRFRATRRPDNGTPLTNNEDLKEHLLRMATRSGYHDSATGYGVLRPFRYFGIEETASAPVEGEGRPREGIPGKSAYDVAGDEVPAEIVPSEYPRNGTLIRGADGELYFIPGDLEVYRVPGDATALVHGEVLEEMQELEERTSGEVAVNFQLTKTVIAQLRPVKRRLPEGVGFDNANLRLTKTVFYRP
jgi:major intracellular serine protease